MRGRNHLRMGACTVGIVAAAGLLPFAQAPAAVAAGIGLFMFAKVAPDLDHPTSAITRSWGPITKVLSWMLRGLAWWVYNTWRSPTDRVRPVIHRGFTHTLPGGLLAGCVTLLTIWCGPIWTAACLAVMFGGAARVYSRKYQVYGAIAGAGLGYLAWSELLVATGWLVVVMALGCYAHAVDDCVTTHGAPLKFPFRDATTGRRWERVGTPHWMRFNTGSPIETAVVWAAIIASSGIVYWLAIAPWAGPLILQIRGVQ